MASQRQQDNLFLHPDSYSHLLSHSISYESLQFFEQNPYALLETQSMATQEQVPRDLKNLSYSIDFSQVKEGEITNLLLGFQDSQTFREENLLEVALIVHYCFIGSYRMASEEVRLQMQGSFNRICNMIKERLISGKERSHRVDLLFQLYKLGIFIAGGYLRAWEIQFTAHKKKADLFQKEISIELFSGLAQLVDVKLLQHLLNIIGPDLSLEPQNFSLCLRVILSKIMSLKLKSTKYDTVQRALEGMFYWLDCFRELDLIDKRCGIKEYRSSNVELQIIIRSSAERLIKALQFNKYDKSPIARMISEILVNQKDFSIFEDILIALVNECCSIIHMDKGANFYFIKKEMKSFNAKPLSETLKLIAQSNPVLMIKKIPIWVSLRQHPSGPIRSAVYSAIGIIFETEKLTKLAKKIRIQQIDAIQLNLFNLLYRFRKEDDSHASRNLMDAFFTLSSNVPITLQNSCYVLNIISQRLVEGSPSIKRKSIQILANELDRWFIQVFQRRSFVDVQQIDELPIGEERRAMLKKFSINLDKVMKILTTLFQGQIDFFLKDTMKVIEKLLIYKMPGSQKLVLKLSTALKGMRKEENQMALLKFYLDVINGVYKFVEPQHCGFNFKALNFLKIFQNATEIDYMNLYFLILRLTESVKDKDLRPLYSLFKSLVGLSFVKWTEESQEYMRSAAIKSLKVVKTMMDALKQTSEIQEKALVTLQSFLKSRLFDFEYVTALLELFTSKYSLFYYNNRQFSENAILNLIQILVLSPKSDAYLEESTFEYLTLLQTLIQILFKLFPFPYSLSKKILRTLLDSTLSESIQEGDYLQISALQFCKVMVFVGTSCLEMKNLVTNAFQIFGSSYMRELKHESTPVFRLEAMLWDEAYLKQIIQVAQEYLNNFIKFLERSEGHHFYENTLRLLITSLSQCFSMFNFYDTKIFTRQFRILLDIIASTQFSATIRREALIQFTDLMLIARNATFEMEIKLQAQYTQQSNKDRESEQMNAETDLRNTLKRDSMKPMHKRDEFRESVTYQRSASAVLSEAVTDRFNRLISKLNEFQQEQLRVLENCEYSIFIQQIILSCFAIITDRKMPGSDIVDLMLTMKASEHSIVNNILEVFLEEVRNRNPSFFTQNFIKIVMSVAQKKVSKDIQKRSVNFILQLIVKQLQLSKVKGVESKKNADYGIDLVLRNVQTLIEQSQIEVAFSCLRFFKSTKKTPTILMNYFPFIKVKLNSDDKKKLFEVALDKLAKSNDDPEVKGILEEMLFDYKRNGFFSQSVQRKANHNAENPQEDQASEEENPEEKIE